MKVETRLPYWRRADRLLDECDHDIQRALVRVDLQLAQWSASSKEWRYWRNVRQALLGIL